MPSYLRNFKPEKLVRIIIIMLGLLALSSPAAAGIYTDELSDCLLTSTTEEDKLSMVRWMFTSMSLHPAVEELADVSSATRERTNKDMAELLVELLSDRCIRQTSAALQHEGSFALRTSFSVLGQVAAANLLSDPNVAAGLASLEQYISTDDLDRKLEIGQ
jgi:predicted RNA binding protein with dsRBD fold (UPF0201 family)